MCLTNISLIYITIEVTYPVVTSRIFAFLDWIRDLDQRDWMISGYPVINIHDFSGFRLRKTFASGW